MNKYRIFTKEGTFIVSATTHRLADNALLFLDEKGNILEVFNWDFTYRVQTIDDTKSMAGAQKSENNNTNKNSFDICDCYHIIETNEGLKSECWGTKEREFCCCKGDPKYCNFYPEKRGEVSE